MVRTVVNYQRCRRVQIVGDRKKLYGSTPELYLLVLPLLFDDRKKLIAVAGEFGLTNAAEF